MTLPDRVLERLAAIDPDRAFAIVKVTDASIQPVPGIRESPELREVSPGVSVIVIGPSRHLSEIEWLRLIEIAPSRFLLILPTGTPVDSLEIALLDLLDSGRVEDPTELDFLRRLKTLIGGLRRSREISKAELLLINRR